MINSDKNNSLVTETNSNIVMPMSTVSPNLPMVLSLLIGEYLTPPYFSYMCKICNKEILDCDERPTTITDIASLSEKTYAKYLLRSIPQTHELEILNTITVNKDSEYAHLLTSNIKFEDDEKFVCYSCFGELLNRGDLHLTYRKLGTRVRRVRSEFNYH